MTEQTLPPEAKIPVHPTRPAIYAFLLRHWLFFGLFCVVALAGISTGIGWSLRLRTFNIVTVEHVQNADIPMLTEYVSNR